MEPDIFNGGLTDAMKALLFSPNLYNVTFLFSEFEGKSKESLSFAQLLSFKGLAFINEFSIKDVDA